VLETAAAVVSARVYLEREFRDGYLCNLGSSPGLETLAPAPREVFSAILASELLGRDLSRRWRQQVTGYLQRFVQPDGTVHFFEQTALLPADVDCTALALVALAREQVLDERQRERVLSAIIDNQNAAGVIRVYFGADPDRCKIVDPVVTANALYAINQERRVREATPSERFVLSTLRSHTADPHSRYYPSPDTFLWAVSRLVSAFPVRYKAWRRLLAATIEQRPICHQLLIEKAQWAIAARLLGVCPERVEQALAELCSTQRDDGSWPAQALYRYGRKSVYFGSPVLTTIFALRALLGPESLATSRPARGTEPTASLVLPQLSEPSDTNRNRRMN
jgi:hypothetical protein